MLRELKLSPLEKKLRQQTLEMGYPDFGAFCLADRLYKKLFEQYTDSMVEEQQRSQDDEATLFVMGAALKSTKDLYLQNGIKFDQSNFHEDEVLEFFPVDKKEKENYSLAVDLMTMDPKNLYVSVAKDLCEKIEDNFYSISGIDPLRTNPRQEGFVKRKLQQIATSAGHARDIGKVISGYDGPEIGGHLAASMQYLSDWKLLYKLFGRDELYGPFTNVLGGHANLHNLKFNSGSFLFSENTGKEIESIMEIAKSYFKEFHAATGFALSDKKRNVVFPGGSNIAFYRHGDIVRKEWGENPVGCVGDLMFENIDELGEQIKEMKSPFNYLGKKLHALGVPFEFSEELANYFSEQVIPTLDSTDIKLSNRQVHAELHRGEEKYADALRAQIEKHTGRKPNPIRFRHFGEGESRQFADAIGPVAYVARNKNGRLEVISQEWTKLDEKEAVAELSEQYQEEDADIYLRENRGVCYLWDSEASSDMVPAKSSIIETRFATKSIKEKDKLASRLNQRQVDLHEVVHAAQVGSILANRDAASFMTHIVCQEAIRYMQDGRMDEEIPYYRTESLQKKGETYRDMWLDFLDTGSLQLLGTGKFANLIRREGMYRALWQREVQYGAGFDIEEVRKEVSLDKSLGAQNVLLVRNLIQENNLDGLRQIERRLYEHSEETGMLIETSAESFSLSAVKDNIMNFPDARYSQAKREQYYKDLEGGTLMRGELGKNFLEVMSKNASKKDREEMLREHGLYYGHVVLDREAELPERRLIKLGYPVLNPFSAYTDMTELRSRLRKKKMGLSKVLMPTNYARAYLDEKYSANIPLMFKVIEKNGGKKAFDKIHSIETLDDLKKLAE